jgi:hypothetical protein
MQIGQEIFAILVLIAGFIFNRELGGAAGPEKEAQVTTDIITYLQSPGGIHVTSERALAVWKVAIPIFIKVLVFVLNNFGLLGNSKSSVSPLKP